MHCRARSRGARMACGGCAWEMKAPPRCCPASTARRSCVCFSARPPVRERLDYLRDGGRIYERSFAIIRAEADLSRFSAEEADVVVRMVHACGCVEVTSRIVFGKGPVGAARAALARGAPILCDSEMVAHGVTRARLPAQNEVVCTLHDPRVARLAEDLHTTRSAAALDLWRDRLGGAEAKDALAADPRGVPFLTVLGRMGGSAMAAAAVNALARDGI